MRLQVAEAQIGQLKLLIALVDVEYIGPMGDAIIRKLAAFYPHLPAMLVSVVDNGFLAHAHFQTHQVLALLQLKKLNFSEINIASPPEAELPF